LRFNQDDNGSLKSKKPWAISEYLYRAVRSEGPVSFYLYLAERIVAFYFVWRFKHLYVVSSLKRKN
jgi:hypothetical protein